MRFVSVGSYNIFFIVETDYSIFHAYYIMKYRSLRLIGNNYYFAMNDILIRIAQI